MAIKTDYLEDAYRPSYEAWQQDPSPKASGELLTQLKPVIRGAISRFAGPGSSPVTMSRARGLALDAIGTYDPRRASLNTHVTNHLRGLTRIARQERQVLQVPERQTLDGAFLHATTLSMEEELGRPPSTTELADRTGMPIRRIAKIRQLKSPVPEAAFSGDDQEAPAVQMDRSKLLLDALYHDETPVNQKILEWKMGWFGQPKLTNEQIAAKLRLTPGAVSQRAGAIQARFDRLRNMGVF